MSSEPIFCVFYENGWKIQIVFSGFWLFPVGLLFRGRRVFKNVPLNYEAKKVLQPTSGPCISSIKFRAFHRGRCLMFIEQVVAAIQIQNIPHWCKFNNISPFSYKIYVRGIHKPGDQVFGYFDPPSPLRGHFY